MLKISEEISVISLTSLERVKGLYVKKYHYNQGDCSDTDRVV